MASRNNVAGSANTWPAHKSQHTNGQQEKMMMWTSPSKNMVNRDYVAGSDKKMMWTGSNKQIVSRDHSIMAGSDKKMLTSPNKQIASSLPQLPVAHKGSELPTLLESMSPASNARTKHVLGMQTAQSPATNPHRMVATRTPTERGQSPASIARLKLAATVPPIGGQSPASNARLKLAATVPPIGPKRNLKALVKDSTARPWTCDSATLKEAGKESRLKKKLYDVVDTEMLKKKLFDVVDCDGNGHIHFSEFLELQRILTSCTVSGDENAVNAGNLEKEFRKWDVDFSLGIDEFEWDEYVQTVLALVGKDALNTVLDNLLFKRKSKLEKQASDLAARCVSERLLEKAMNIPFLGKSHAEQADLLLQKGADPNVVDDNGESVLHHLAAKCEPAFMVKLLESGGNAALNSNAFDSAVLVAARARRLDVLRTMLFQQSVAKEMHLQSFEDDFSLKLVLEMHALHEKQIRELVQNGADINYRNTQGWIPLTSAVFWGRTEAVETLIRLPITNPRLYLKVDIPNLKGRTALHVAVRKNKVDLIPLLVGARADVNARDIDGWTPLHHAVFNSRSEAVRILYDHGARMTIRSHRGITPFMLASSSDIVSRPLTQDALELLQPPDCVRFKEVILPILRNDSLLPYEKLCALMDLPGVYGMFENLRLYDQVFRLNRGPNKVVLNKLWELLGREMLMRLRSEEVDLEPFGSHSSDAEVNFRRQETKERQELQQQFVTSWLLESAGPPASPEWIWDNREGYREQITECSRSEIQCFEAQCEEICEILTSEPGGPELVAIPHNEILQPQYLTQLGAHPILKWIDCADIIGAFCALSDVKSFGNSEDDNEGLLRFMEMASTNPDFMTGPAFWQNVYKLWLTNFACLARPSFHVKMQKFVDDFNSKHIAAGLEVTVSDFHTKTFQELKSCEREFGKPGYHTHDERVVAAKALNVISCSLVANGPATVASLIYAFRQCTFAEEKFELVRIQNGFHKDAESCNGLREVIVNVVFKGGHCHSHGAREGAPPMSVMLVGEVRIAVPQMNAARQGMKLLSEFIDGKFDPKV
jgi:ankyrin repeat protein